MLLTYILVSGNDSLSLSSTALYALANALALPLAALISFIPYARNSTWGFNSSALARCSSILLSAASLTPVPRSACTYAASRTPNSDSPCVTESPITSALTNFSLAGRLAHSSSACRSASSSFRIFLSTFATSVCSICFNFWSPFCVSAFGLRTFTTTTMIPMIRRMTATVTAIRSTASFSSFSFTFLLSITPTSAAFSLFAHIGILYCFSL